MAVKEPTAGGESGVGLNRQGSGDCNNSVQKGDLAAMTYDAERSIVVLELCANASLLVQKRDSQCVGAANTSRRPAGFLVDCKKRQTGSMPAPFRRSEREKVDRFVPSILRLDPGDW